KLILGRSHFHQDLGLRFFQLDLRRIAQRLLLNGILRREISEDANQEHQRETRKEHQSDRELSDCPWIDVPALVHRPVFVRPIPFHVSKPPPNADPATVSAAAFPIAAGNTKATAPKSRSAPPDPSNSRRFAPGENPAPPAKTYPRSASRE